jgi:hypothetical protein
MNGQPHIIYTRCRYCGASHDIEVGAEDWAAWKGGAYAQTAFPYLSTEQREMLISQTCDGCWSRIFGEAPE